MINRRLIGVLGILLLGASVWAASDFAPAVPDLNLPVEEEAEPAPAPVPAPAVAKPAPAPKPAAAPARPKAPAKNSTRAKQGVIDITTAKINNDEIMVENVIPDESQLTPLPATPLADAAAAEETDPNRPVVARKAGAVAAAAAAAKAATTGVVPARETDAAGGKKTLRVTYRPLSDRDPTLSPDDMLLIQHREEERLRALEAEKQRKLEEERRRLAEIERLRQLELERLRDPSREIRGKIRINGIIGQEVFIGNKVYTVGKSVLGAKIVSIQPDSVVFLYKGQKFTKKVQLK